MAASKERFVRISDRRLLRVIEALSYASIEDFESCLNLLKLQGEED